MNNNYEAGWQAYHRGDMDDARECFQRAIRDAKDLKDNRREMEAKWRLGMVYEVLGRFEEAKNLYNKRGMAWTLHSVEILKVREPQEIASLSQDTGSVYLSRGEYDEASGLFEESLKIRKELGDMLGVSSTLFNMAMLSWIKGEVRIKSF